MNLNLIQHLYKHSRDLEKQHIFKNNYKNFVIVENILMINA